MVWTMAYVPYAAKLRIVTISSLGAGDVLGILRGVVGHQPCVEIFTNLAVGYENPCVGFVWLVCVCGH